MRGINHARLQAGLGASSGGGRDRWMGRVGLGAPPGRTGSPQPWLRKHVQAAGPPGSRWVGCPQAGGRRKLLEVRAEWP